MLTNLLFVFASFQYVLCSSYSLNNWMSWMPVGDLTMNDISIPGTHDTLTYDLSTRVSQGGWDGSSQISALLHAIFPVVPGSWIRTLAQTQGLTITDQLNGGIRYIDFRMMRESDQKEWFSLHFVQSSNVVEKYFQEIRSWMDANPSEIVVIQCSKHGNGGAVGNDAYPGVSVSDKQALWGVMEKIFDGLMFDNRVSQLNTTSIKMLVERNHRAIFFMGDYVEFTNTSPFALNSQLINQGGLGNVFDPKSAFADAVTSLPTIQQLKETDKAQGKYTMFSMANAESDKQIEEIAYLTFLPFIEKTKHHNDCAALFTIEGTNYCPTGMLQHAQLAAYYNQIIFELAFLTGSSLPNAIILDAVDMEGTIRTSSTLFPAPATSQVSRYAYAHTMLAINLKRICSLSSFDSCATLKTELDAQRSRFPYYQWDEPATGRKGEGWQGALPSQADKIFSVII